MPHSLLAQSMVVAILQWVESNPQHLTGDCFFVKRLPGTIQVSRAFWYIDLKPLKDCPTDMGLAGKIKI